MKKKVLIGAAIAMGVAAVGVVGCVVYVGHAFRHLKFVDIDEEV